jgi:preprotein translocase subunit SecE
MATDTKELETTEQQTTHETRTTAGPERLMLFLKDVRAEMRKVITPSRAEVQSTTIIVVCTVFLFAAYFELVDLTLGRGVDKLLLHLTKH